MTHGAAGPASTGHAPPARLPRLMLGYFALAAIFFVTLAASQRRSLSGRWR